MKTRHTMTALAVCAAALLAVPVGASAQGGTGLTLDAHRDLAKLYRATARFHVIDRAKAAGWDVPFLGCAESPAGGMGQHYVNIDALADGGALEVARPEALMYEPQRNGRMQLVGVEYVILASDLPATEPAPELFGQHFHFNPTLDLWALHVWLWKSNPSGLFADWNPRVSCRYANDAPN